MYLVFDTETNGLPPDYKAPMTNLKNWPRVIQLGFQVYDENQKLIHEYESLVIPVGFSIPNEKFWIDNGFSDEICIKNGKPIADVLDEFRTWNDQCEYMVGHNVMFDYNILGAEFIRAKMRCKKSLKRVCTKETLTNFCAIPNKFGKNKWPTLTELHFKLFNENFEDAHQADVDVKITAKCFFEAINRNLIVL